MRLLIYLVGDFIQSLRKKNTYANTASFDLHFMNSKCTLNTLILECSKHYCCYVPGSSD